MEYLDCCITAIRACCKKDGHCGRQACIVDVAKAVSPWRCILWIDGLGI